MSAADNMPPMMRHYLATKEDYPDAILLYRVGDFYEVFFDDAKTAAALLDLTLTSRNRNDANPIPMAGVPHHAIDGYIQRMVEAGHKVAICDQVEDPKEAKGMVRREITRVVTPGLNIDDSDGGAAPRYLACLDGDDTAAGVAFFDLGTGEFKTTHMSSMAAACAELARIAPVEILLAHGRSDLAERISDILPSALISWRDEDGFAPGRAAQLLQRHFGLQSLDPWGLSDKPACITVAAAVLEYLLETQKSAIEHVEGVSYYEVSRYMILDDTTRENLELLRPQWGEGSASKGSLLWVLNSAMTRPGARLLRNWILYPLLSVEEITARQNAVAVFFDAGVLRRELREELKGLGDLERLLGRFALGRGNARDMVAMREILLRLPLLQEMLVDIEEPFIASLRADLAAPEGLGETLHMAIVDEAPALITQGGMFRKGFDDELDELIDLAGDGKSALLRIEAEQREATGIPSLKVKYNRVFGYFIEVTKTHIDKVPADYVRKQTISTGERYITDELKKFEDKILGAEERRKKLEEGLFETLRRSIVDAGPQLKRIAAALSRLDVFACLADVAARNNYCRPVVEATRRLHINEGRHPVVERSMTRDPFVPNDMEMDGSEQRLIIITGPNMAGKSTVMRQAALIVLMAQIGSWVPAREAIVGVADRIFTRIGASDSLARGRSTFMVEMEETSRILQQATERSLILLDEIGRGTSTFDGVSIAWAVAEYIHDRLEARTLFATHYHELTELELTCEGVKNFNIAVKEYEGSIIFLRRLVRGGTNHSYGIHVGRMAGLPATVVARAGEILSDLEQHALAPPGSKGGAEPPAPFKGRSKRRGPKPAYEPSLFDWAAEKLAKPSAVEERLRYIDPQVVSPIEALQLLADLKKLLQEEK